MDVRSTAEHALLRELGWWWETLNTTLFARRGRRPVLALEQMSDLGRWTSSTRTISLSWSLVTDRPWLEVVEVLKHEMAHQHVDETLGVREETAHGATFRAVCHERGIDPRAVGTPPAPGQRAVLRRVQKLLALAESPNENEARAALAAASRLMDQEGLGGTVVEGATVHVRQLGAIRARTPRHEQILAGVLGGWFDVAPVWVQAYDVATDRRGRVLEVTGRPERVAVAEHVHVFLLRTAERLWRDHRQAHRITSDALRRRFLEGVLLGFRDTLVTVAHPAGTGLMRVADGEVLNLLERRHPTLRVGRRLRLTLDEARTAGRAAGGGIRVHDAVESRAQRAIAGPTREG